MSQPQRQRVIGWLLAVVYGLTTTTVNLFHDEHHDHGHAGHAAEALCHAGCASHADAHDVADHDAPDHNVADHVATEDHAGHVVELSSDQGAAGDDECQACQFLGLSSLAVELPTLPECGRLVAAVRVVEPRHDGQPLEHQLHSRAPPQLV